MNAKNIHKYLQDVLFVKTKKVNTSIIKYANFVDMDILKQKKKNVFIVEANNMEVLLVMNVDMN